MTDNDISPPRPEEEIADASSWRIVSADGNHFVVAYENKTIHLSENNGKISGFPKEQSWLTEEVKSDIEADISFLTRQKLIVERQMTTLPSKKTVS